MILHRKKKKRDHSDGNRIMGEERCLVGWGGVSGVHDMRRLGLFGILRTGKAFRDAQRHTVFIGPFRAIHDGFAVF